MPKDSSTITVEEITEYVRSAGLRFGNHLTNIEHLEQDTKSLPEIADLEAQRQKLFGVYESSRRELDKAAKILQNILSAPPRDTFEKGQAVYALAQVHEIIAAALDTALSEHLRFTTAHRQHPGSQQQTGRATVPGGYALPTRLPHPTFIEARTSSLAISDAHDLRYWGAVEGAMALLHSPPRAKLQTRFEPGVALLGWWGFSPELTHLQDELQTLEFDAVILFNVCLSWAIETPGMRVRASLDALIAAIGRADDARRSKAARAMWRSKVWRWLLIFDSLAIIGARPGIWKEPRSADERRQRMEPEKLYSRDVLLKIIGERGTEQPALDGSAVPKEVSLVAGDWLEQFQGNHEFLSYFGNLRAIAALPRGKPSGAWAACAALMLNQKWREGAAKATRKGVKDSETGKIISETLEFKPFTRRDLLLNTLRSGCDVKEVLDGNDPAHAKKYWQQAIKLLKDAGLIGFYKELKPLRSGYRWQEEWLDQPLDIRPKGEIMQAACEISTSAIVARRHGQRSSASTKVKNSS